MVLTPLLGLQLKPSFPTAAAFLPCKGEDRRLSGWVGSNHSTSALELTDQVPAWTEIHSGISAIAASIDPKRKCLSGLKVNYGHFNHGAVWPATLGSGVAGGWMGQAFLLKPYEFFTAAELKSSSK
jgi:hypothetical protein